MDYKALWIKIKPFAGVLASMIVGGGATIGTNILTKDPEINLPISAGRQQLIEAGHVDSEKIRDALNNKLDEIFKDAGFCKDPVVADRDIGRTARAARCPQPAGPQ